MSVSYYDPKRILLPLTLAEASALHNAKPNIGCPGPVRTENKRIWYKEKGKQSFDCFCYDCYVNNRLTNPEGKSYQKKELEAALIAGLLCNCDGYKSNGTFEIKVNDQIKLACYKIYKNNRVELINNEVIIFDPKQYLIEDEKPEYELVIGIPTTDRITLMVDHGEFPKNPKYLKGYAEVSRIRDMKKIDEPKTKKKISKKFNKSIDEFITNKVKDALAEALLGGSINHSSNAPNLLNSFGLKLLGVKKVEPQNALNTGPESDSDDETEEEEKMESDNDSDDNDNYDDYEKTNDDSDSETEKTIENIYNHVDQDEEDYGDKEDTDDESDEDLEQFTNQEIKTFNFKNKNRFFENLLESSAKKIPEYNLEIRPIPDEYVVDLNVSVKYITNSIQASYYTLENMISDGEKMFSIKVVQGKREYVATRINEIREKYYKEQSMTDNFKFKI